MPFVRWVRGFCREGERYVDRDGRPARLLIADDHVFMRAGVATILSRAPDLEAVGEAGDGEETLALCRTLRPDLVLMDVTMPKMDGIEATRLLKAELPKISVLMHTDHFDPEVLLDAVRAGAAGYVNKGSDPHHLIGAVRAVLSGETPLEQGLAMKLLRRIAQEDDGEDIPREEPKTPEAAEEGPRRSTHVLLPVDLTPRETEILGHLARGRTNRQIGKDLHLSLSTVKRHLERIISKLGVSDRTQAAVRAVELGLLSERNE
jgi:NarL family two-component system response regulator LiaR